MPSKKDYATEAKRLARAIELAINSFEKYPPEGWDKSQLLHTVQVYSAWKEDALHPAPQYKKLASLQYTVEAVLTFFQEATGKVVEDFWEQVAKEGLGYERVDRLRKALNRGKIRGRLEYDQVTDTFIAAKQEGRITEEEASRLGGMIGEFEKRKR
jgi:hypothetical protein